MDSYQHPTSELELVGILDKDSKKKGQNLVESLFWVHMMICLNWPNAIKSSVLSLRIPSLDPSEYERILQIVINWVSNVTEMPKVETVVQGLHQAGTGFQKLILRTFWAVRKFVLTNRVWAQN